jgi:hypothetical protein
MSREHGTMPASYALLRTPMVPRGLSDRALVGCEMPPAGLPGDLAWLECCANVAIYRINGTAREQNTASVRWRLRCGCSVECPHMLLA